MRMLCSAILVFSLSAICSQACGADAAAMRAALDSIRAADLQNHIDVLADDTFEGRQAGSRGGRAAASYIRKKLESCGFSGGGVDGSWYQSFHAGYRNVLGVLEGSDPKLKQEFIVLGAHYDHVGYGSASNSYGPTGYIHNGADDNASGVSALLEIAQALDTLGIAPRRSILIAFWDGEEEGLLGSKYWTEHPTIPLQQITLAVNIDMIGRMENANLDLFGTRTASGLRRIISRHTDHGALNCTFKWEMKSNSDHWSFYQKRIPVIMLHTGLHDDYHRPRDDSHKINEQGMQTIVRMLLGITTDVANAKKRLYFRTNVLGESESYRYQLERPLERLPSRLGVLWQENKGSEAGLRLSRVVYGSAAERAGLKPGDRILEVGERQISSGDDLRSAVLASPKKTTIKILSSGAQEPKQIDVQLNGNPVRVGIAWREDQAEMGSVILSRVVPGSPAAKGGLRLRDRIYQVQGKRFAGSDQFAELLAASSGQVALVVESRGRRRTCLLDLPEPTRKQQD